MIIIRKNWRTKLSAFLSASLEPPGLYRARKLCTLKALEDGGRTWDRTTDPFHVKEVLSR
jgi:hypothetical protein